MFPETLETPLEPPLLVVYMVIGSEVEGPRTSLRSFIQHWSYYEVWFCMEECVLGRDWVAVIRIIEVTALWMKQYIVYIRWAFGTSNTGRIMVGDRINKVTVDWCSTVIIYIICVLAYSVVLIILIQCLVHVLRRLSIANRYQSVSE